MNRRILLAVGILGTVGLSLLPFLWFVLTSFKSQHEIEAAPPGWWPSGSLGFYRSALFEHHLFDYALNSMMVAGSALARLTIPGKQGILAVLLCVSMFPQMAIAGPVWRLLDSLGGLNHRWGVVLPYVALTLPLAIWILASFFKELPPELEDAARVDGCGPWATLFRITLPLATPGIFTAAILILIYAWNEFFFALLILTQPEQQTIPVGIALFQGEFTMPWGELAAASVLATLPLIVVVLLCQRWIVSGLSAGAVKG